MSPEDIKLALLANDPDLTDLTIQKAKNIKDWANFLDHNTTLASLRILSSKIGNDDANALVKALKGKNNLVSLDLCGNKLDDEGMKILAEFLKDNILTSLNLSLNKIGDEGVKILIEILKHNIALNSLSLGSNKISSASGKIFANFLTSNQTLISLDLSCNTLGDNGVTLLANSLQKNKSLRSLNLAVNNITSEDMMALAEALHKNKILSSLNLLSNKISDKNIKAFINALKSNTVLTSFSITPLNIDKETIQELELLLNRNKNIQNCMDSVIIEINSLYNGAEKPSSDEFKKSRKIIQNQLNAMVKLHSNPSQLTALEDLIEGFILNLYAQCNKSYEDYQQIFSIILLLPNPIKRLDRVFFDTVMNCLFFDEKVAEASRRLDNLMMKKDFSPQALQDELDRRKTEIGHSLYSLFHVPNIEKAISWDDILNKIEQVKMNTEQFEQLEKRIEDLALNFYGKANKNYEDYEKILSLCSTLPHSKQKNSLSALQAWLKLGMQCFEVKQLINTP